MMLGLLSHEPHFSLLREEVTFGRKSKRMTKSASGQNFYLLHLSLLREYLGFEFESLDGSLPFPYDFERILDDFILLCFFVGNDFLPHLPGLNINEGALGVIFDLYKSVLPTCQGYLNNNGYLNVEYCQKFFEKLETLELDAFNDFQGDSTWMEGKKGESRKFKIEKKKLGNLCRLITELSEKQREIYNKIKFFVQSPRSANLLHFNWSTMPAGDRAFVLKLIESLGLGHTLEVGDDCTMLEIFWAEDDDESDEESVNARERVLKKYDNAETAVFKTPEELKVEKKTKFDEVFQNWKKDYYRVSEYLILGKIADQF